MRAKIQFYLLVLNHDHRMAASRANHLIHLETTVWQQFIHHYTCCAGNS